MKSALTAAKKAVFPAILFVMTFFVFGSIEMYFANQTELWFSVWDIFVPCLCSALIAAIILIGITMLAGKFSKRATMILTSLIFSLGLALYIQGNYMVMDYGVLDGKAIQWENYTVYGVLSSLVWVACIVVPLVLLLKKEAWFEKIVKYVSLFIVAIQVITLGVLFVTNDTSKEASAVFTTENQFELSKNENTIVFIVDSLDAQYVDDMLVEFPEVKTVFKDFTYFNDALSVGPTTRGNLPFLLTGELYLNSEPLANHLARGIQEGPVFQAIRENGYEADIYTSGMFAVPEAEESVENLRVIKSNISDVPSFVRTYFQLIAFRYAPHYLKESFWISNSAFDHFQVLEDDYEVYSLDNLKFLKDLKSEQLCAIREASVLKIYHLIGTHPPLSLDDNLNSVASDATSGAKQGRGCLKIIEEYISQLKELGLYDGANIVIMADHGCVRSNQCPAWLIKRSNNFNASMVVNEAPVSYVLDWTNTLSTLLCSDLKKIESAFDISEGEKRDRKYYYYTWDNRWDAEYMPDIYEYQFTGKAKDMTADAFTGRVYRKQVEESYIYHLGDVVPIGDSGFYQNAVISGMPSGYVITNGKTTNLAWLEKNAKIELELDDVPQKNLVLRMQLYSVNGYEQRIEAFISGTSIGEQIIALGEEEVEFFVPRELIKKSNLTIEFQTPDAAVYNSYPVPVSMGITSFQLLETDETSLPEKEHPWVNQNVTLSFSAEGEAAACETLTVRGVYPVQGNAAWSAEKFNFTFNTEREEDIQFIISYGTYYSELDAIVTFNGVEVSRLTHSHATEAIVLPAELVNSEQPQIIEITVPGATSPQAYGSGNSADQRILGLCLTGIQLDFKDPPPTLTSDTKIVFEDASTLSNVEIEGVYPTQGASAWTSECAEFTFHTSRTEDIVFNVVYGTFYERVDAIVLFNDTEVGRLTKTHSDSTIVLPKELISQEGPQRVKIVIPGATSPALYGAGTDTRVLGLCLTSIGFSFQ